MAQDGGAFGDVTGSSVRGEYNSEDACCLRAPQVSDKLVFFVQTKISVRWRLVKLRFRAICALRSSVVMVNQRKSS